MALADSGSYYDFDGERSGKRRDRVAEALLRSGASAEPVGHWLQIPARAFQGAMGGYMAYQDQEKERGQERAFLDSVGGMFDGGGASSQPSGVVGALIGPQPTAAPGGGSIETQGALAPTYVDAIKGFEGYTPTPKWDYKQYSSGYGTKAQPGEAPLSQEDADRRLQTELGQARGLVQALGVPMTEGQEAALTSLTYNAGTKWMNSGLGEAVRKGDWETADRLFRQYVNAGGKPLPGLENRRNAEAAWMRGDDGASSEDTLQNLPPATRQYLDALIKDPRYRAAGIQLLNAVVKKQLGASGAEAPSNVREWEYFRQLSPEQQQQYLTMKRAEKYLDTETGYVRPNPVTGEVDPVVDKDIAGKKAQEEVGKAAGQAQAGAPSAISKAENSLKTLEQVRGHSRREAATGRSALLPTVRSKTRDFEELVGQLKGQSFLAAFQDLKGGGHITEIEGEKATQAIARLELSQSEDGFLKALDDLEEILQGGLARAKAAQGGGSAPAGQTPSGKIDLGDGFSVEIGP